MTTPAFRPQKFSDLIPPDTDLPPSAPAIRFAKFYAQSRDLADATFRAKLNPDMGEKLFNEPRVRLIIDRQIALFETELAKLQNPTE